MAGRIAKVDKSYEARRPHFVRRCYTALSGCFFTIQRECVYCAVQSGTLNIIRVNLSLQIGPSPVSIIPPMLHAHLCLYAALTRMTNGRSLKTFKRKPFRKSGVNWIEKGFHSISAGFGTSTTWKLQLTV